MKLPDKREVTRPFQIALLATSLLATSLIVACGPDRSPTAPPPPTLYRLNGTWAANGPGLVDHRFTFHEEVAGGGISGTWSGTKVNCVGAGCSVSGSVTSWIRTGNYVQLRLVDEANYFGVVLGGTLANDNALTGEIGLYWSNPPLPGWLFMGD